jgi:vitamin B12 transporter
MKNKIFMVAAVIFSGQLKAQNITPIATNDSTKSMDEVVITATKFPKRQSETGKVVTVITNAQLQRSSGKDLSQLLNEQAGLVINGANSNPGKDKSVFLRGASSKYTLILLDGIPVTDPSGVGGAFDLRLLSIDQIERIEILKGSQSTLYGSDAIAGVINIITKKSGSKNIGAAGTVSYGSYNTFKGNAVVNGSTQKVDYNIGYTYFKTDGISEAADKTGNSNFDKDGYKENSFNASVGIKATDKLKISPFFRLADYKGNYDDDAFTDGAGKYNSKFLNTGFISQYKLSQGAITLQYGHAKTDRIFDGTYGKSDFKGRLDNAELFYNTAVGKYVQLLSGINFQQIKMLDTTASKKDPSVTLTSPYISLYLHNLHGWNVELGGRYNNHSKYGSNFTYSFNPSYLIDKTTKLFFNYSTGFKAPTLYDLYGKYGSNENLKPEKSTSIEAGVQTTLAENKIELRVVAFDRKIKDAIVYGPSFININQDRQHDKGFEIEPTFFINKNLTVRTSYAFVDGDVTTPNGAKDTTYFNLIRRPKHSFSINIACQASKNLFVNANLKTFSKRTDLFFDPVTFEQSTVELKAYALLDVYAEYKLADGKLKVFADAKNITDSKYTEVYGFNTLGFNINAGISFKL